jgi:cyclase
MLQPRLIPVLLVDDQLQLVKTTGFNKRHYLGDPLNAAYVFSGFEVDELLVLDIDASTQRRSIPLPFVAALARFTSVPLTVGGGISNLEQIHDLLALGVEKVVLGAVLRREFSFLKQAADRFGSSTISVILNVRSHGDGPALAWLGRPDATGAGPGQPLAQLALACQQAGAGEVVIQAADRDGQRHGYAVALLAEVNRKLTIPLVALGGCGCHGHMAELLQATPLSGVAAGSLFVYAPGSQQVLLHYPPSHRWLQQQLPTLQEGWQCA